MRRIAEQGFAPFVWCSHADRHGDCLSNHADHYHQQRKACAGGVDVGLEQGFTSHAISLPLAWNRVPPDALQREAHLDGAIGWAIEDQLRLASG